MVCPRVTVLHECSSGTKLLKRAHPGVGGRVFIYEDFRNILSANPRPASG